MSGASHTPGPWWLDETDPGTFEVAGKPDGFCAPVILSAYFDNPLDARLIAAAPDLLEALDYARAALGTPVPVSKRHVARKIDAAIAKARGEAQ